MPEFGLGDWGWLSLSPPWWRCLDWPPGHRRRWRHAPAVHWPGATTPLAVKSDGTVWAWGFNSNGQLGDGTTVNRTTPVQATGLSGAIYATAGGLHSLGQLADGSVFAWGSNSNGQIGNGTTIDPATPTTIGHQFCLVAAGQSHSLSA